MTTRNDKFDYLISLAAVECMNDDAEKVRSLDVSNVTFDKYYYRKKRRVLRKYDSMPFAKGFRSFAVKAAVIVMAILSSAVILISCVPNLREAIFDAIVEWYDNYITIHYDPSESNTDSDHGESTSGEAVKVPTCIEEVRKPRNLPEGVWEDVLVQNTAKTNIDYYKNDIWLFSFSQLVLTADDKYLDNENAQISYIDINGSLATIIQYEEKNEIHLIWTDGKYYYYMISNICDIKELTGFAESVE